MQTQAQLPITPALVLTVDRVPLPGGGLLAINGEELSLAEVERLVEVLRAALVEVGT